MSKSVWFKPEHRPAEVVDRCSASEAGYTEYNYRMAFGCLPGQHRHGKDKVWVGRRDEEPKE